MKALFNGFLSLIYPKSCVACNSLLLAHERIVCQACVVDFYTINIHESEAILSSVFAGRVPVLRSYFFSKLIHENKTHKLLHALKYGNNKAIAQIMGKWMYDSLRNSDFFNAIDIIIPNPLHINKFKQRGYNQSELIALEISTLTGIPIDTTTLIKTTATESQTRKSKIARWENVNSAYKITKESLFANKHLLIVDDVITTGATIEGIWQSLKEIEGVKISLLSFAYTV
jgi:ComF family protein